MKDRSAKDQGQPPKTGWQALVCELHVEDITISRHFWCELIGFSVAYERSIEKFLYLELKLEDGRGPQIMLCQRNGRFETGPMKAPLGQGVMFQLNVDDIRSVLKRLSAKNWPIHTPERDVWREVGDRKSGQREVFVQDPDGYLLMLNENLGERK